MSDINEVKDLIESQAKARKAEIEILESKTMTKAEAKEALDKINADFVAIRKEAAERAAADARQIAEIEKKAGRPQPDKSDISQEQAEYKKAFANYLRNGRIDGMEELHRKAMNSSSDPDGGYLVLPEIDRSIDRFAPVISAMYRLANIVTIGSSVYEKMFKYAGMSMRRVADGATGGETTEPKFAKVRIEVFPAEVEPWVYNETLQDAFIDLETDLANEAGIGFAEGAGAEFITGNGIGKAMGITSYTNVANASYSWGNVGYIASGKSAAFTSVAPGDAIVKLQHALKQQYRPGASFLMNDATLGVARQMKDQSGQYYLWNPNPLVGFGGTFIGSPVEIDNNMPDIGAGSYSVAFGNFQRGYTIVNRAGTTLIRDNITAKGTTKFNFRRRFGAGISNFEAIKLMKFATS